MQSLKKIHAWAQMKVPLCKEFQTHYAEVICCKLNCHSPLKKELTIV